jgi:hypothetical protein
MDILCSDEAGFVAVNKIQRSACCKDTSGQGESTFLLDVALLAFHILGVS